MPVLSSLNLSASEQSTLKKMVWQVLHKAVSDKSLFMPDPPESPLLLTAAACFVTLYINGQLRGCIGTYSAERPLWENVCTYSYYSACEDRRFNPLREDELSELQFEISILSEPTAITNNGEQDLLHQLSVGIDGLILKEGHRSALFLPSVWHSLTTPYSFLQALKQKGGWDKYYWSTNIKLSRFTAFVIKSD